MVFLSLPCELLVDRINIGVLPYRIFKVELEDMENGDRGEGLYYMEKENYVQ